MFSIIVCCAVMATGGDVGDQITLRGLQPGDVVKVVTSDAEYQMTMVQPRRGEVRLTSNRAPDRLPMRAFINGSTHGPQPQMLVMMGVIRTGMRLEIVTTGGGGPGAKTGRALTAKVLRIERVETDRGA